MKSVINSTFKLSTGHDGSLRNWEILLERSKTLMGLWLMVTYGGFRWIVVSEGTVSILCAQEGGQNIGSQWGEEDAFS